MVPAGNKAKCLSLVNHTTKTIHHHYHQGWKKWVVIYLILAVSLKTYATLISTDYRQIIDICLASFTVKIHDKESYAINVFFCRMLLELLHNKKASITFFDGVINEFQQDCFA